MDERAEKLMIELACLKSKSKALETQIEQVQTELLSLGDLPKNYETKFGTLVYGERQNYTDVDNNTVIQMCGQEFFHKYAKITVGALKKGGGDELVRKMATAKAFAPGKLTRYYSLKEGK